jgi:hypothetical protein
MGTFVFGEEAITKNYLRMFLLSAATSGLDVAVIGSPSPNYTLPDNVRHFPISWNDLVDRIYKHVLHHNESTPEPTGEYDLKSARPYKVADFKPLLGYLFPEVVDGYEWWGHCDNDLVFGNVMKFLERNKVLDNFDTISGVEVHYAWGPFMLYRNTPVFNELFRANLLDRIFTKRNRMFDEWGQSIKGAYEGSMSGIIDYKWERLGLRPKKGIGPNLRDIDVGCYSGRGDKRPIPARTAECVHHTDGTLIQTFPNNTEVNMCHYQWSKKKLIEPSLVGNQVKLKALMEDVQFRVSCPNGFDYFNSSDLLATFDKS